MPGTCLEPGGQHAADACLALSCHLLCGVCRDVLGNSSAHFAHSGACLVAQLDTVTGLTDVLSVFLCSAQLTWQCAAVYCGGSPEFAWCKLGVGLVLSAWCCFCAALDFLEHSTPISSYQMLLLLSVVATDLVWH
jgi:hypothetical protein